MAYIPLFLAGLDSILQFHPFRHSPLPMPALFIEICTGTIEATGSISTLGESFIKPNGLSRYVGENQKNSFTRSSGSTDGKGNFVRRLR
jgi:hypothetical protein